MAGKNASSAGTRSKRTRRAPVAPKPSKLWMHPKATELPFDLPGPLVKLGPRRLLTVDDRNVLLSGNGGRSWSSRPVFEYGRKDKEYKFSNERCLLRTAGGAVVLIRRGRRGGTPA